MSGPKEEGKQGITPEKARELQKRSEAFSKATQKKGMPMTYGTGKPAQK